MTAVDAALGRVSVLIVNYNAGDWLARAVDAVRPAGSAEPEIVVVDNGSADASLDALDADAVRIDRAGRNLGFAGGINRAARHAHREFLLLLNPDSCIEPGDLARLVGELEAHAECALVSGRILGLDGREQRASRRLLPTPSRIVGRAWCNWRQRNLSVLGLSNYRNPASFGRYTSAAEPTANAI